MSARTPKERETILIVDDEPAILEVTGDILNTLGYEVLVAKSGPEAVHLYWQQGRPDRPGHPGHGHDQHGRRGYVRPPESDPTRCPGDPVQRLQHDRPSPTTHGTGLPGFHPKTIQNGRPRQKSTGSPGSGELTSLTQFSTAIRKASDAGHSGGRRSPRIFRTAARIGIWHIFCFILLEQSSVLIRVPAAECRLFMRPVLFDAAVFQKDRQSATH